MRATLWFIGCALCIAGIGSAAAASLETQDVDSSPHATIDNASPRDSNTSSGGDALGLNRECPSTSNNSSSTSSNSSDRSGGGSSAPAPTRRPHLGWQSLLPGSIQ
ncbi:hypothetical protein [Rhodanobacter panaciterrae]|uniref:hypothetical protein n=1 Tax=Rhodanobacter panaciterrae TaxID=490572 RepID=UPI001673A1BA|nr:hypothetical protein [Rhodanobacter panaciterrae]